MKPKQFISISTGIVNNKLILINTSAARSLYNENGIDFTEAIEFLFNLVWLRGNKFTTIFVCYAFARDNEFLFSTAPNDIKDRLFKPEHIRKRINELEYENESFDNVFYSQKQENDATAEAILGKRINRHVLNDLSTAIVGDYKLTLINGKSLQIKKGGKSITFYDVYGFFKPQSLRKAVKGWFDKDIHLLDRKELAKLKSINEFEKIKLHSILEVSAIAKLSGHLNEQLENNGIYLSRFHGASALSSRLLGQWNAKSEFHNYRYQRQLSPELYKAVRQANYGGRTEQLILGTVKNVYIYDINSAYANACTYLPKMLRKPVFRSSWDNSPFSCWFVNYDFRNVDNFHIGCFPNRDLSGATRYKVKGSGYFWQPEVVYALQNYPDCVEIKGGFSLPYEQTEFSKGIETIYALRLELQRQNNPFEKVLKLALASLYGKFCQHNGKGYYYNLFYAGFITSFVRAQLLNAVKGYEQETISFQVDAVHSTSNKLFASIGDNLGDFKRNQYESVTYLDNGVYRGIDLSGNVKIKSRGFQDLDFDKLLLQFQNEKLYTALAEFFVGHNLYQQDMFRGAKYLSHHSFTKEFTPLDNGRNAMRLFEILDVDLSEQYFNSKPVRSFSGLESLVYKRNLDQRFNDGSLSSIEAGRM